VEENGLPFCSEIASGAAHRVIRRKCRKGPLLLTAIEKRGKYGTVLFASQVPDDAGVFFACV